MKSRRWSARTFPKQSLLPELCTVTKNQGRRDQTGTNRAPGRIYIRHRRKRNVVSKRVGMGSDGTAYEEQEKESPAGYIKERTVLLSSPYALTITDSPLGISRNCRNSSGVSFGSRVGWIVPGLLWLWLFAHLRVEWTLNSQYNYGWAVPFLGALLFYFRWQRRPAPDVTARQGSGVTTAAWLILVLLLPIRAIEEANPDWRFLSWVLALSVVAFSLLALFAVAGTPWLRHFAFPICFFLVAVPWPVQFENMVVQAMMRAVAYVAVEIAGWFGLGAYQLGNVIQLRNGFVGVDEACSGVKTLQAGIMVALVLGELLQLRSRRRVALFFLGCC